MAKAKYSKGKDGYYRAKVWDGTYNSDGSKHRINLTSKKSSGDLERKVIELKNKVKEMTYVPLSDITVYEYALRWLGTYKAINSINTRSMYKNIIHAHFKIFDMLRLQDYSRHHIQGLINSNSDKSRTCQILLMTHKQLIKSAIKEQVLPPAKFSILCDDIKTPKYIAKERRILTEVEIEAIKKADFNAKERCYIFLLYGCGLRKQEALALTVDDVDLVSGSITVSKAICYNSNTPALKETKTVRGHRTVPMPEFLQEFIKEYMNDCDGILIPSSTGGYMSKTVYRRFWQHILDKINAELCGTDDNMLVADLTAHMFRHNYCTRLCYQIPSISTKKIAQLLGDTEKMVLDVYSHILDDKEDVDGAINRTFDL